MNAKNTAYDVQGWKCEVHYHKSIDSFVKGAIGDGIHQISVGDNQTLDFYVQDFHLLKKNKRKKPVVLVGFTGAVSGRNGQSAPFFSGLRIAKEMNLPIISVADPSLALDSKLALSWYAGNQSFLNPPSHIAQVLELLARECNNAKLVLFGGSGGGFASLSLLPYFKNKVACVVWNPQTAIEDYVSQFVVHYLTTAFSDVFSTLDKNTATDRTTLGNWLSSTGIVHNLQKTYKLSPSVKLLYIQNKSDWHVGRHAIPFLNNLGFGFDQETLTTKNKGNISVFAGDFGDGHAIPEKEFIKNCLLWTIGDKRKLATLAEYEKASIENNRQISNNADSETQSSAISVNDFDIEAVMSDSVVTAKILLKIDASPQMKFAFYLAVDGERIASQSYSDETTATFKVEKGSKRITITGFVLKRPDRAAKKIDVTTPDNA